MNNYEIEIIRIRKTLPLPLIAKSHRTKWAELIKLQAPYAAMLTINFAHPYPDAFLLSSMNEFVKQLNRKVLRRWVEKGYYLDGICSVEVCRDGTILDGCLHFHLLIKPSKRLNRDSAEKVLLPKVLQILKGLKDSKGRSISNKKLVKVSPYTGVGCLPSYLTKESEHRGIEADGFIGFLAKDGIVGLQIPRNRKKRDLVRVSTD